MKVISMVPSWTETLLECGIEVVGRTRYCIHPETVKNIAVVGGTKNIDWQKLKSLSADLMVLDQEENPKNFYDESPIPCLVTHVTSVKDVSTEIQKLNLVFKNQKLKELDHRWKMVLDKKFPNLLETVPGSPLTWWKKTDAEFENVLYLIWKKPWMTVSEDTFIGSMLEKLGVKNVITSCEVKYPQVDLNQFDPQKTLLLFSSEPFPFEKYKDELMQLDFSSALIDGEKLSWFGLRSLNFLESISYQ